jgi:hypothetical protein
VTRSPALWIRESEVTRLVDLGDSMRALRRAFELEAEGGVAHLEKR